MIITQDMDQSTPTSIHKKIIKRGTFILDMYKLVVEIYVMKSSEELVTKVKQLCRKYRVGEKDVQEGATGYTLTFSENPGVFYVLFSLGAIDVNTITHETDHLRTYMLQYQGVGGNEETSANLNGYLNEKVFRFLEKNNILITY